VGWTAREEGRTVPRLTITRGLLDLLADRRVYHQTGEGERWRVGDNLIHGESCALEPYSHFNLGYILPKRMGAFSYANGQFALTTTEVGRYCSLGQRVLWMGPSHPVAWATTSPIAYDPRSLRGVGPYLVDVGAPLPYLAHPFEAYSAQGPRIGNDVWIGDEAAIRDGVVVGDGAVVGARSVVTKDVPPYAVVAGSPARVVRDRFPPHLMERFLALQWWRFGPDVVQPLDVRTPEAFLGRLEEAIGKGAKPFEPTPLTLPEILAAAEAG
jgi:acetyltransferase-like isoleucine patch superfamily enzyme